MSKYEATRSKLRGIFSARKIIHIRRFSSAQQAARYSSGKADKSVFIPEHLYFITTSLINKNFKFLNQSLYANAMFEVLTFLRQKKRTLLFAFVIMPNHLHLIVKTLPPYNISQIMHSLKSYSSKRLKKLLKENNPQLWKIIQDFGGKIWEEGFFDENIYSQKFLNEKIEYIHNNPLNRGWRIVKSRSSYKYSSACYYDLSQKPIIEIDDIELILKGIT